MLNLCIFCFSLCIIILLDIMWKYRPYQISWYWKFLIVVNCYDDKDIARGKVFIEKGGLTHFTLNKKSSWLWEDLWYTTSHETADLVTFTEETLEEKVHFFRRVMSVNVFYNSWKHQKTSRKRPVTWNGLNGFTRRLFFLQKIISPSDNWHHKNSVLC